MSIKLLDAFTFDPERISDFLNAQKDAEAALKARRKAEPRKSFGIMRPIKGRIDVVEFIGREIK